LGCIQAELDIEGLGEYIDLYALHPGGALTDLPKSCSLWYSG
jgi:hypothetical protein